VVEQTTRDQKFKGLNLDITATWSKSYKTFYSCDLQKGPIGGVFVPGMSLQPSLIFACMARNLP
jgi:hypothetical protein